MKMAKGRGRKRPSATRNILPTENMIARVSIYAFFFFPPRRGHFLSTSQQLVPPQLSWLLISTVNITWCKPTQSNRQKGHGCFAVFLWFGFLPNCLLMLTSRYFIHSTSESLQQSLIIPGSGTIALIGNQPECGNNNLSLKHIPRIFPQNARLWVSFKLLLTTLQQSAEMNHHHLTPEINCCSLFPTNY